MSIEDMLNHIEDNELTKANSVLNDLLADRINTAMDQEKVAIANTVFNGTEEIPDEDQIEMEFDDDEDFDLEDDNDTEEQDS